VICDDLNEGDAVVVMGNHELEEGMEVKATAAESHAPATGPSPATEASQ
jgi:hypothetical protein